MVLNIIIFSTESTFADYKSQQKNKCFPQAMSQSGLVHNSV